LFKKILPAIIAVSFVMACPAHANEEAIGYLFKDKPVVKVCVKDVTNVSGQNQITIEEFKAILETSLINRKAITFKIVGTPAESDIQISAVINKFAYLVRGPLKPSMGIETTLLDAAATATENYAEMAGKFTVLDTKSGNILWSGVVEDYLKKIMTAEESIALISDKVARGFIWKCFGKANFRLRRGFIL
jgi:hypothetical protein